MKSLTHIVSLLLCILLLGCKKKDHIDQYLGAWEVESMDQISIYNSGTNSWETETRTYVYSASFNRSSPDCDCITVSFLSSGLSYEFLVEKDGAITGRNNHKINGEFVSEQYATWNAYSRYTQGSGTKSYKAFKVVD